MATKPPVVRKSLSSSSTSSSPATSLHTPRRLKTVEAVTTDSSWCCIARSSTPSPSAPLSPATPAAARQRKEIAKRIPESAQKENIRNGEISSTEVIKKTKSSDELNRAVTATTTETLKHGEVAALLKQGYVSNGSVGAGGGFTEKGNGSPFKIRLSPGRVSPLMEISSSPVSAALLNPAKLNSLFNTTGFLSQSSPPVEKTRSSPTLFEMMVHEQELQDRALQLSSVPSHQSPKLTGKQISLHDRLLSANSPGSRFNDPSSSDVKLVLTHSKEGLQISISLHAQVLASHSQFFAAQLSERWSKPAQELPHVIQISECEDMESYIETIRLMYCRDMKRKLLKENVLRVLGILKVSAAIMFEAGILSCLEYLEAVPWAEEEEEKVTSVLSQLQLDSIGAGEVLKRLSTEDSSSSKDILMRLLQLITKGTDEKARKEMKGLVSRMLRENAAQGKENVDLSKESLYQACQGCLDSLLHFYKQASSSDFSIVRVSEDRGILMAQITRQADNLNWLVDIMIDRQIADDFVRIWALQTELVRLHGQVPIALGRYEVSRLTARLCVAVGQGQVLAPKEIRFTLLQNWLQLLIDDFGWMQRACKGLDRKLVEEGISQTILTLPLKQQQSIMIAWFDKFLKNGDDCPNLQRAFEIWWRRTFVRPQNDALSSPHAQLDSCASPSTTILHRLAAPENTVKANSLPQMNSDNDQA